MNKEKLEVYYLRCNKVESQEYVIQHNDIKNNEFRIDLESKLRKLEKQAYLQYFQIRDRMLKVRVQLHK